MSNINLGTVTVTGYSIIADPEGSFELTITAAVTDPVDPVDPVDPPDPEEDLVGVFVAPDGNNSTGDGTVEKPFKTIKKAFSTADPGDTIYLRGGDYGAATIGEQITGRSGTKDKPIKITNHPGEIATIDGKNFNNFGGEEDGYPTATDARGACVHLYRVNHVHLEASMVLVDGKYKSGIHITRGPTYGVTITGGGNQSGTTNGVRVKNCEISRCGWGSLWEGKGIAGFAYQNGTELINNDCHHNRDKSVDNADGIQWMALGAENKDNVIRGNRLWNNSDDGLDMFNTQGGTCAPVLVENNFAYLNGYDDDNETAAGDGMGFKVGGKPGSGGHTVQNNVAWGNRVHGFDENSAERVNYVYNNTGWNNHSKNYGFWSDKARCVLRNNISHASASADGTECDDKFNSWNLSVTVTDADFVSLDDAVAIGPRQADGSLPDTTFLTLAANSDLRNKGTDVGIPFTGSAPDLGWKETA